MADPSPYTKTHFPFSEFSSRIQPKSINQGKSCSGFLFKYLFLALFVIVLPLFPSQAPDFVKQTILTKFWELLHLLFIGIAVAYGLFSRRNVEADIEIHSSVDSTPNYVSKMFPVSTIFGDGYENPCGYDEKRMMHCWNAQYFEGEPGVVCSNGGTVGVFDEQYGTQLPISADNFVDSVRYDGTNVVQAWNSEYYHSEPVVVVAQPYYTTGECGEVDGYKPLGLPVRSLRSVAREIDSPKYTNESDSSSGSRGSFKSSDKSRDREFGDLGPSNLEQKFTAAAAPAGSASPIPLRSRSRRMEREKKHGNVTHPSHFRPLSVDETTFEALSSRSLKSTTSFSSHTSMYSSLDSISSDNMNFQEEDMGQKKASYVHASENMNFQEEDMGQKKTSYVHASENMNFQEEDMGQKKTSYVHASETMTLREEDFGQKTFYVHASETMNFREEDFGQKKTSYVPASEIMNFQEEDMGQKKTSYVHASETMNFREEDFGQKKTSYVPASEIMNFQEEDMGLKKTSYVPASEIMNFQEEDMGEKKTSYVPASENINFQEEDVGTKKTFQSSPQYERMASKGKYAAVSHPLHFRPMSVDETQFKSLSSRSFQSMESFSSRTSLCSSLDSVSSDKMNLQKEDLGEKESSHGSSPFPSSSSPSPPARRNGEASLQLFHARGRSIGSLLQDDMKSNLKDDLRGLNGIEGEDPPGNKESGMQSLQSDSEKPASLAKAPQKGKSVRTRRASGLISETVRTGEICSKQADEKVEKKPHNVESVLMRKDKMKSQGPDPLLKGTSKKNLDAYCPKPEVTLSNHHKRDKQEPSKNVSKEESDIELENFQLSSGENEVSECVNDSGLDSEVDKKASEFIAKFKAQIRLQKMGSIERSKGQKTIGNYIR